MSIFTHFHLTDVVSRQLTHTANELEKLKTLRKVRYATISQILSQCMQDVQFFLNVYMVRKCLANGILALSSVS